MTETSLSTAELRKPVVAAAAVKEFSRGGFHGTTVADVAKEARISPAYVMKLFPRKEQLFVAALETCFERVLEALARGAEEAGTQSPQAVLDSMAEAYARLISDRTLLLLQVHAQSVADMTEIGAALRAGLERVVNFAQRRSGAPDESIQRFMAFGQLCHLVVSADIIGVKASWAEILTAGLRHPD